MILLTIIVIISCPHHSSGQDQIINGEDSILDCLHSSNLSQLIHLPENSTYTSVLQFSLKNTRFNTTAAIKPSIIVTPDSVPQIQATVLCSKTHNVHIRIRSGGHDFEGLSYTSQDNSSSIFLLLDLIRFRNITIDDQQTPTAWVQAAVTTGELYYRINQMNPELAFPSAICTTVGFGGQISGGGWGTLLRKYGLAADNVVDANLIDAEGRLLDRASMGEDLFWAIRGGGGNTFGVVVAWKVRLVKVPANVTVCNVVKTLEQNVTDGQASFNTLFLGKTESLIPIMDSKFPELGLRAENCTEMSWAMSNLFFSGFTRELPLESLLDRTISAIGSAKSKVKSDYVKDPIPMSGLEGIWEKLKEVDAGTGGLITAAYGGKMREISESSIPFPHRDGIIYQVQELTFWGEDGEVAADRQINWLRGLYDYMAPFVSKNPREAYVNYRDLDLGTNGGDGADAGGGGESWELKYFKGNLDRLVKVKTAVDAGNLFRNEQSIQPL
ncbi:Tetrahydroberberine oxidase [Linum grandiflorum]